MQAIAKFFPLAFLALIVILVALFGNFRDPLIILCVLPFSLIGVAVGMLMTGFEFGFFPIAGWLGLLGMIIKNVIVLLDYRIYRVAYPTCTDGCHHHYSGYGSPIVRCGLRWYGGYYYLRIDIRNATDFVRHSGTLFIVL